MLKWMFSSFVNNSGTIQGYQSLKRKKTSFVLPFKAFARPFAIYVKIGTKGYWEKNVFY